MTLRCHLCRSDRLMSPWNDGDKWRCRECGAQMVYPAVILEVVKEAVPTDQP